jgi:FkbM family methyltransferase
MFGNTPLHVAAADLLARTSLRFAPIEQALAWATRRPRLRRGLRLGAVAHGYPRVLGRKEVRLANLGRYLLYVNVAEPIGVASYFFGEPCTVWFADRLVRPGDTFVDAGANIGHYTLAAASLVGPTGHVVGVEANPELASMIERSIEVNGVEGSVAVERRALWSISGETKRFLLSTNTSNSGTSSLVNHGVYVSPEVAIDVVTVTLDDLARERQLDRIRFLKIDVERAEDEVVLGAQQMLAARRIDYLLIEMHAGTGAQAVLEANGYVAYLVEHDQQRLIPSKQVSAGQFGDFLFLSPDVVATPGAGHGPLLPPG